MDGELYSELSESLYQADPDLYAGVLAEFRRGWEVEAVMTRTRQARIAEATQRLEHAAIEGVGQKTMEIDAGAYHYWGQREGYGCWEDKQFRHEFARDNPEVRVRNVARRTTVVKARELPGIVLTDRRGAVLPTAA